jgi:hypothetical protein
MMDLRGPGEETASNSRSRLKIAADCVSIRGRCTFGRGINFEAGGTLNRSAASVVFCWR